MKTMRHGNCPPRPAGLHLLNTPDGLRTGVLISFIIQYRGAFMTGRSVRGEGGPGGGGLELWLVRTLQGGILNDLPRYYPLGDRVGRRPEQYARTLLAALREHGREGRDLERTRDDGRAFRSWAESRPATAGHSDRRWSAC